MDLVQQKELKTKIRTLLVTYVCALTMSDITSILESEIRRERLFDNVIEAVRSHFPSYDPKTIRTILDSVVGNMTQCLKDLGNTSTDADPAKLEHWTNVWRA